MVTLLDLFCGAGGAAVGYHRAGFDVMGIDIKPQPNYPFTFIQGDALAALQWQGTLRGGLRIEDFDLIHASPPCQAYTHARHIGHRGRSDHPKLISPVRALLKHSGLPFVIENVEGAARELRNPLLLCGSMFGLAVKRHRLFECSFPTLSPSCFHGLWGRAIYPGTPRSDGSRPLSRIVNPMASGTGHTSFASAMGIDWMPPTGFRPTNELQEAIPPAFTRYLGEQFLDQLARSA